MDSPIKSSDAEQIQPDDGESIDKCWLHIQQEEARKKQCWLRMQQEEARKKHRCHAASPDCVSELSMLKSIGSTAGGNMTISDLFRNHFFDIARRSKVGGVVTNETVNEAIKELIKKSTTNRAGLMVIPQDDMTQLIVLLDEYLVGVNEIELADCLYNLSGLSASLRTKSLMNLHESSSSIPLTQQTFVQWFFVKCYENVTYPSKLRLLDAYYRANKDRDVDWHVFFSHFIKTNNVYQILHADYITLSRDFILKWLDGTDELLRLCLTSLCADSKIDLILRFGNDPRIGPYQDIILNGIESEYVDHMVKNGISKINFDLPLGTTLSITNDNVKQYIDFMAMDTDQKGGIGVTSVSMAKIMNDIIAFTKRSGTADNKSHLLRIIENNPNLLELFFTVDTTRSYLHILEDLAGCIGYPRPVDVTIDLSSSFSKIYFTYLLIKAQVHLDNDTVAITSREYGYLNTHVRSLNASEDIRSATPDQINQAISNKQWSALSSFAYAELSNLSSVSSCAEGIAFKNFREVELSRPNGRDNLQNMIRQAGSIVQVVMAEMHAKNIDRTEISAIESAMTRLQSAIDPRQVWSQCNELSSLIENSLWIQQGLLSKLFELLRRIVVYFKPSLRNRMFFADPSYVRCPNQLKDIGRLSVPQNSASGGG